MPLADPLGSRAMGRHRQVCLQGCSQAGLFHPSSDWQALAPPAPWQHMCELLVVSPPHPLLAESSSGKRSSQLTFAWRMSFHSSRVWNELNLLPPSPSHSSCSWMQAAQLPQPRSALGAFFCPGDGALLSRTCLGAPPCRDVVHLMIFRAFPNPFLAKLRLSVHSLLHCGEGGLFVFAFRVIKS